MGVALAFQLYKFIFHTFVGVAMLPTAQIFQWPMRLGSDVPTTIEKSVIIITGYMMCIVRRLNKNKRTKHSCLVHLDSSDEFRLLQI